MQLEVHRANHRGAIIKRKGWKLRIFRSQRNINASLSKKDSFDRVNF